MVSKSNHQLKGTLSRVPSNLNIVYHSTQTDKSAKDIRTLRNLSNKLVISEERDIFFGNLNRVGVGVKEVEDFV